MLRPPHQAIQLIRPAKKHTSQSSSNVNFNESPVKVEHSFNHQQQRSQQKSAKYTSNKAIKRRQQLESANYNENQHQNESEYNQFNSVSPSSQFQPQLVPIQTFTFFKWKINVDTLVRMFIIAMICLMVINAMLYYKLRRIESLADSLRSDPNIIEKMSIVKTQQEFPTNDFRQFNEHNLYNDLFGWRDVISNTLNVIEKMEASLKEWDKSLEKRQLLEASNLKASAKNAQGHEINSKINNNDNNNDNIKVLHSDDL